MVSQNSELAIRYAKVSPDNQIKELERRQEETILGYTKYLNGHRIKIQGNLGYAWSDGKHILTNTDNFWFATFQVEFGI